MALNQTRPVRPPQPAQQNRLMIGGIAVLGIGAIIALAVLGGQSSFEPTQPPDPATTAHGSTSSNPVVSVVRVDAGGNAVIAGTAVPSATVTIMTNGTAIGTATADRNGAFAFVTSRPLPAGAQDITLSARLPNDAQRATLHGMMLNVPVAPNEGALAVLGGKNLAPSHLLGQLEAKTRAAIGSVDYAGSGSATIAGTAKPDTRVELFMGKTMLGKTTTGQDGHWEMYTQALPKQPGRFHLKAMPRAPGADSPG
jgi:hypothetical protein